MTCAEDGLLEGFRQADKDGSATLRLAPDCTYELHEPIPTVKQEITIEGERSTISPRSEEGFRIFRIADGGHLTLKNLSVKHGRAGESDKKWDEDAEDGGALLVERGGRATLVNVTLARNSAGGNGGAIANFGQVEAMGSTIDNNHAGDNGGGIFNAGQLEVKGSGDVKGSGGGTSRITNNTAGESGGGIYNGGTANVTATANDGNHAGDDGGGIFNAGVVEAVGSTINSNHAGDDGGGIYNGGTASVTSSTNDGNHAGNDGGGIYNGGQLEVKGSGDVKGSGGGRSRITNNTAGRNGGGIYNVSSEGRKHNTVPRHEQDKNRGGTATVSDSEIVNNRAGRFGGGIFNGEPVVNRHKGHPSAGDANTKHEEHEDFEGILVLSAGKIMDNFAGRDGGGIYNNEGKVILDATPVTNNSPRNCAGDEIEGCDD